MSDHDPDDAAELEAVWKGEFGDRYVDRNSVDYPARYTFWDRTIDSHPAESVLEVGCAHGDNFRYMADKVDLARACGVDINRLSLDTLRATEPGVGCVLGAARHLPIRDRSFDMVFTIGLLIHQPDSSLATVVRDIVRCSSRWVMFGEYSADEPTEIEYRGRTGLLFKRDYVSLVSELCPDFRHVATEELTLADDGFNRVTWGVFERRP